MARREPCQLRNPGISAKTYTTRCSGARGFTSFDGLQACPCAGNRWPGRSLPPAPLPHPVPARPAPNSGWNYWVIRLFCRAICRSTWFISRWPSDASTRTLDSQLPLVPGRGGGRSAPRPRGSPQREHSRGSRGRGRGLAPTESGPVAFSRTGEVWGGARIQPLGSMRKGDEDAR